MKKRKKNGGKKQKTKNKKTTPKQGQSASLATEKGLCINSKNKMWIKRFDYRLEECWLTGPNTMTALL